MSLPERVKITENLIDQLYKVWRHMKDIDLVFRSSRLPHRNRRPPYFFRVDEDVRSSAERKFRTVYSAGLSGNALEQRIRERLREWDATSIKSRILNAADDLNHLEGLYTDIETAINRGTLDRDQRDILYTPIRGGRLTISPMGIRRYPSFNQRRSKKKRKAISQKIRRKKSK